MRAAFLTENGFELREIDTPELESDEILIKTKSVGVCSGDLFVYKNKEDFIATYNRLGHEASGEVVSVGSDISDFKVGDMVTSMALPSYAEYFVAKPIEVAKLPAAVDPNLAIGEAVACCVHAANRFGTRPGDKVAVVGLGFMGLVPLQLAKYQGASEIIAIDPIKERRELAETYGAIATYNPFETTSEELLEKHGNFNIVIEAAGVQSAVDLCTDLVDLHGKIILIGYHQSNNGLRTVNMERWNYKAIDVINGHVRREDEKVEAMRQGMQLMAEGHIRTEEMLTFYPFDKMEQAFQDLAGGKQGLLKAVLQM